MKVFQINTDKHPDGSWTIGGGNFIDVFTGALALFKGAGASLFIIWFFSWPWFWKVSWFFAGTILLALVLLKFRVRVSEGHFRIEKTILGIPYSSLDIRVDAWESKNSNEIDLYTDDLEAEPLRISVETDENDPEHRWLVVSNGAKEMLLGYSEDSADAIFRAMTRAVRQVYAEKERHF